MLQRRIPLALLLGLVGCAQIVGLDELRDESREPEEPVAQIGAAGSTSAPEGAAGDLSGGGVSVGNPSGGNGARPGSGGSAGFPPTASDPSAPGPGAPGASSAAGTGPAAATPGAPLGTVSPDAGPAALGPAVCGQQMLVNGGFDDGAGGWDEIWDARKVLFSADDPLLVAAGVPPASGSALAWIGGVPNGEFGQKYTSGIQQEVVIPSDAIALSVSGQIWVQQPQLGQPFPAVDWVVLELLEPINPDAPEIAWQIETWSDADVSPGWVAFESLNINEIARLRGRRLLLSAASRPDGNGTLSVWLDSLRLEARCP